MIKILFFTFSLFFSEFAIADSTYNDIEGKQNRSPLKITGGIVCFVEQPLVDEGGYRFADAINLFFIPDGLEPVEAKGRGLLYDLDAGTIVDAFTLDVNFDGKNELVIIHFVDVRHSLVPPNTSGKFYSVYIFN